MACFNYSIEKKCLSSMILMIYLKKTCFNCLIERNMFHFDDFCIRIGNSHTTLSALSDIYKKPPVVIPVASTASTSSTLPTSKLRLPKLQLPTFTGSYTDCMSFIIFFRASVDKNIQVTNSEKLNYLKARVKGDATKLNSSITITDPNFIIAIDLLIERHENRRSIVQAHLQKIWGQRY